MSERFSLPLAPAHPDNVFKVGTVRVSVLTPRLIRVEAGYCTDLPTQMIWHRDLGKVPYRYTESGTIVIRTEEVEFVLNAQGVLTFASDIRTGKRYTTNGNLKGTARTLDNKLGAIRLPNGLLSTGGLTFLKDDSLLLDGATIRARSKGAKDGYYFAYGHDYRALMQAFYSIAGRVPMIPRYALGNWWSRYKAYSADEYLHLMEKFEKSSIPFTVATVDMDWHWTDVINRFGEEARPIPSGNWQDKLMCKVAPGWTGYSWNTDLFPDYRAFLAELHRRGYRVPLNVHPANGVRFFENQYEDMCKMLDLDASTKQYIPFKLGDNQFLSAYFDVLHHPYEEDGVDLWWLDWQQGNKCDVKGLDPLWGLNHYHYLDADRGNTRPLILSRFAGFGSHRYPLGFSGDSAINWASLRFQPYFTATASNAGYTWWSHDIGGHHWFKKDDELYLRWLQFGVHSPINRLHSTSNVFMGKEPWTCAPHIQSIAETFLRIRHHLLPFLYSAMWRTHNEGIPICAPMYFHYPEEQAAYTVPNQYMLGSRLIVAPITEKINKLTGRASVRVWLPKGEFFDVFTGQVYTGGGYITMCRPLTSIPVLAKLGTIIPAYRGEVGNRVDIDTPIEFVCFHGTGKFVLYEDDGISKDYQDGKYAITRLSQRQIDNEITFSIAPVVGDATILPEERTVTLRWTGVLSADVTIDCGATLGTRLTSDICLSETKRGSEITISYNPKLGAEVILRNCVYRENVPIREALTDAISSIQMNHGRKQRKYAHLIYDDPYGRVKGCKAIKDMIYEIQYLGKAVKHKKD